MSDHRHPDMRDAEATGAGSRLFTVGVWAEVVGGSSELRGEARDVTSGASRGLRTWENLTGFLAEQLDDQPPMKETP